MLVDRLPAVEDDVYGPLVALFRALSQLSGATRASDRFRLKQVGPGQCKDLAPARVGTMQEPYLHYSFAKGLTDWFDKLNRYASAEAAEAVRLLRAGGGLDWEGLWAREPRRRRRALKALSSRLPYRPLLRFLYMYVVRPGFLDGRAGLTYCGLLGIYEYPIVLKMRELLAHPPSPPAR